LEGAEIERLLSDFDLECDDALLLWWGWMYVCKYTLLNMHVE
jgi:hypothetical protein